MPPSTAALRTRAKATPDNRMVAFSSLNLVKHRKKRVTTKTINKDAFNL